MRCGLPPLLRCGFHRSYDLPMNRAATVKFEIYRGGAVHPIHGDETRFWHGGPGRWMFEETQPSTAVLALRHPCLDPQNLQQMHETYFSKLREGEAVAVVQDWRQVFVRTKLLARQDAQVLVQGWQRGGHARVAEAVETVPVHEIYGGWPALSLLLSHPIRALAKEVQFLWPEDVSSVVIKRKGEVLDSELGLGSLLRNSENLTICIDGVDYPLEHDIAASHLGAKAEKERDRRFLKKMMWSQAGGCGCLLMAWFFLEWRISCDRCILPPVSPVTLTPVKHPKETFEEWGPVGMGWCFDDSTVDHHRNHDWIATAWPLPAKELEEEMDDSG